MLPEYGTAEITKHFVTKSLLVPKHNWLLNDI